MSTDILAEPLSADAAVSAYGKARSTVGGSPLAPDELHKLDAYWRASLYLCLGMLYLKANPLLREPLTLDHLKPRLLGHWGSDAGQSFTYTHFNRLIRKYDLDAIFISGPGTERPLFCHRRISKEDTPRSIRTRVKTRSDCSASSSSSPFPVGSAVTPPPKHPAAFTRAASSATASRTRMARLTTIQI